MAKRVLTFDLGASSGRAIIATYENSKVTLKEVHRFLNEPVTVNKTLYWDILRLFEEIKKGIIAAKLDGGFDSIGIDTWGVDFGIIDERGDLTSNPVHYRDMRTDNMDTELFEVLPKDKLYSKTGIQIMRINTIFQMYYLSKYQPEKIAGNKKLLFIPDLLAYFLTGEMRTEYTIASTSGLLDASKRDFDEEILDIIGMKKDMFAPIIQPGEQYGMLSEDVAEALGCERVPVIACATHDTASAVVAVPSEVDDFYYISCGTWSLFGTELKEPVINKSAMDANITNEGGYDRTIRFLKNIMGLWVFQETCRQWQREGKEIKYDVLDKAAVEAEPFMSLINPDHPMFEPYGDMPKRIKEFCKMTGQKVPETDGEIVRCIYESLAFKYKYTLENMSEITGHKCDALHMVGGGIKAKPICKFASSACDTTVVTGPVEATAMGNAVVQLISLGEIADLKSARKIIKDSTELSVYKPENPDEWNKAYEKYIKLLEVK